MEGGFVSGSAGFRFFPTITRCAACCGKGTAFVGLFLALAAGLPIPFTAVSQAAQRSHTSAHHRSAGTCDLPSPPSRDILKKLATNCCVAHPPTDAHCKYYSATDKYVVVKDANPRKPDGYLVIPSFPVTGIEDTRATEANPVVNFWQFGWNQATNGVLKKQPRNVALAINSKPGRDQDQLHIHLSCVLPSVAAKLAKAGKISTDPTKPTDVTLGSHNNPYEVVMLTSLTGASSPFRVIENFPHAKSHVADQSIAIIGTGTNSSYYMAVTYYVQGKNPGTAEELLDQTDNCDKVGHHHHH